MFGATKRKKEVDEARAKVRELTDAIAERRKPGDSARPPTSSNPAPESVKEQFTPNGSRRVVGFGR